MTQVNQQARLVLPTLPFHTHWNEAREAVESSHTLHLRSCRLQPPASDDTVTLRFLHTNDVHGTISPVPDRLILGRSARLGGSAYLATVVRRERSQDPQHTLLLDAGDCVHGQATTDLAHGLPMAEIRNAIGYDVGTIGNHDFQWGVKDMEARLSQEHFPNVVANVTHDDGTALANSQPYIIKDMGGVKVGIVGLLTSETKIVQRSDRLKGVAFADEVALLGRYADEMKQQGADLIVCLTHVGVDEDFRLARSRPNDHMLFIGGHSHDRIQAPLQVDSSWVVQAGSMGKELGLLEVDFDRRSGHIVDVRHNLLPVDPQQVAADAKVAAIVERYQKIADEEMGHELFVLPQSLVRSGHDDSSLGNVVADAMRMAAGTDVALTNSDGLRADLASGSVTLKDLYAVMPFGGELMKGTIRGSDLREALEHSVTLRETKPGVQSGFLQVSGLTMEYDAGRPAGQQVTDVKVGGRPLESDKMYTIALEDYLVGDKLGYHSLVKQPFLDTSTTIMDAVREHLAAGLPDTPGGRILDRTPAA